MMLPELLDAGCKYRDALIADLVVILGALFWMIVAIMLGVGIYALFVLIIWAFFSSRKMRSWALSRRPNLQLELV
jgi:hypothetical protein